MYNMPLLWGVIQQTDCRGHTWVGGGLDLQAKTLTLQVYRPPTFGRELNVVIGNWPSTKTPPRTRVVATMQALELRLACPTVYVAGR